MKKEAEIMMKGEGEGGPEGGRRERGRESYP